MNIVVLQTFLAIVETGSLVRASERLNVTQSTVTARLRTLEDELGQTLLLRQKSGATLTPAGAKLMRYADAMVGLWRQARYETGLPQGTDSVCNFGCHADLWPGPGRAFFNAVNKGRAKMALAAWQGEHAELDRWLGSGLLDAVMTYRPTVHGNQTIHALRPDEIVLFATEPDRPMRFDPGYVFVDLGEDFRTRHATAYADADTARIVFGTALWALEFLLENGGSAYLPGRLAAPHLAEGRLFAVPDAPAFRRNVYLVVNDRAAAGWTWLPALVEDLSAASVARGAAGAGDDAG
ncbi:MAG: LysR family transcriptional regulator [Geminicoccaceae bacterium]|nr:LysR family transcriptional regulator [Geminicoccaceae bacterium]